MKGGGNRGGCKNELLYQPDGNRDEGTCNYVEQQIIPVKTKLRQAELQDKEGVVMVLSEEIEELMAEMV